MGRAVINYSALEVAAQNFTQQTGIEWRYSVITEVLDEKYRLDLLKVLPALPYQESVSEVHKIGVFDVLRENSSAVLAKLSEALMSERFLQFIEKLYMVSVRRDRFSLYVHRMTLGDYVRIHTDWAENGGKVKFTIYPHSTSKSEDGNLILYNEHLEPSTIVLPCYSNWAFCFHITRKSYHAVNDLKDASLPRYSILFTLF